jgi:preprotein translocase subunit SecD
VARRIDALGVAEAAIQVLEGSGRILVELPGVTDPEQAVNTLQQTALLEFVDFSGLGGQVGNFVGEKILTTEQIFIQQQRAEANAAANGGSANQDSAAPEGLVNPQTRQPFETVITGAGLQAAAAQFSSQPGGSWHIQFDLNSEGGEKFGPFTRDHVGEPLAIVLDGVVLSAPTIQSELPTGGVITGKHPKSDHAQRIQVRANVQRLGIEVRKNVGPLLRRSVIRCAAGHAGLVLNVLSA